MGPERGDVPVHEALGIFSWDPRAEAYTFRTYTARGGNGDAHRAELDDGRVAWSYEDPSIGTVRYTITVTPDGTWHEIGDASADGGATWHRFFEMTLRRAGRGAQEDGDRSLIPQALPGRDSAVRVTVQRRRAGEHPQVQDLDELLRGEVEDQQPHRRGISPAGKARHVRRDDISPLSRDIRHGCNGGTIPLPHQIPHVQSIDLLEVG